MKIQSLIRSIGLLSLAFFLQFQEILSHEWIETDDIEISKFVYISNQNDFADQSEYDTQILSRNGNSIESAYLSIFSGINHIYEQFGSTDENQYIVVYLRKGTHYLLDCENKAKYSLDPSLIDYCSDSYFIPNRIYANPYLHFFIKPLLCELGEENEDCLHLDDNSKIKISANSENLGFNITSNFYFERIEFDGINQLFTNTLQEEVESSRLALDDYSSIFEMPHQLMKEEFCINQNPTSTSVTPQIETVLLEYGTCNIDQLNCTQLRMNHPNYFELKSQNQHKNVFFNIYSSITSNNKIKAVGLRFRECSFTYFIKDYEALIGYEEDNYNFDEEWDLQKLGGYGGFIRIEECIFQYNRFCKGVIVYHRTTDLDESFSLENLMNEHNYDIYEISIVNSSFVLCNIHKPMTNLLNLQRTVTLKDLEKDEMPFMEYLQSNSSLPQYERSLHYGILNLQKYYGDIIIHNTHFKKNFLYIPNLNPVPLSISEEDTSSFIIEESYDLTTDNLVTDFGNGKADKAIDQFERFSPIYISHHKKLLQISHCSFTENIGSFGGAVLLQAFDTKDAKILLYENTFEGNYAYFSGSALLINLFYYEEEVNPFFSGGNILIKNNVFSLNNGYKLLTGGALTIRYQKIFDIQQSINANYYSNYDISQIGNLDLADITQIEKLREIEETIELEIFTYKLILINNTFDMNFGGFYAASVSLINIDMLSMEDEYFVDNRPIIWEYYEYNTYWKLFGDLDYVFESSISDEYSYLEFLEDSLLQPQMQGALDILFEEEVSCSIRNISINLCTFESNDPGPIYLESSSHPHSQSIFIQNSYNLIISNSKFTNHTGMNELNQNSDTYSNANSILLLIGEIFNYGSSSIIQVLDSDASTLFVEKERIFQNCSFFDNYHAKSPYIDEEYTFGSLIRSIPFQASSPQSTKTTFIMDHCIAANNSFLKGKGLIYFYDSQFQINNSDFILNGIALDPTIEENDFAELQVNGVFYIKKYFYEHSAYGNFLIENSKFISNVAQYGGAISLITDDSDTTFELIELSPIYVTNCQFQNNFATKNGGAINIQGQKQIIIINSTLFDANCGFEEGGALYLNNINEGMIETTLDSVNFTNCFGNEGSCIYFTSYSSNSQSPFILRDCFLSHSSYYFLSFWETSANEYDQYRELPIISESLRKKMSSSIVANSAFFLGNLEVQFLQNFIFTDSIMFPASNIFLLDVVTVSITEHDNESFLVKNNSFEYAILFECQNSDNFLTFMNLNFTQNTNLGLLDATEQDDYFKLFNCYITNNNNFDGPPLLEATKVNNFFIQSIWIESNYFQNGLIFNNQNKIIQDIEQVTFTNNTSVNSLLEINNCKNTILLFAKFCLLSFP